MQINAITPKITISPKKQSRQTLPNVSTNVLPRLSYDKIPTLAFSGHIPNLKAGQSELSALLKKMPGEVYQIELLDKIKGQKVKAFFGYSTSKYEFIEEGLPKEKCLIVYSEQGKKIGNVDMNFSDWQSGYETAFKKGLPDPFVHLHQLKNNKPQQYKGVGGALIQASIEKSLQTEAKGKIYVHAFNAENMKNDPIIFYNKMGLTLNNPYGGSSDISSYIDKAAKHLNIDETQFNALIKTVTNSDIKDLPYDEKVVAIYKTLAHQKKCGLDEVRIGANDWMYLYDDAVKDLWLPKIETNPIFSDSNRLK